MNNLLLFIYLLYIQILPITQDNNQVAVLALLLFASIFFSKYKHLNYGQKKFIPHENGLSIIGLLLWSSIIFTAFGSISGQPGASDYFLLDIIFPVIYIIIFCSDYSYERLKIFNLSFTVASFIIGVLFLLQLFNFAGGTEFLIKLSEDENSQRVATDKDGVIGGLRFIPLYSLSYLTPITLHFLGDSIGKISKYENHEIGFKNLKKEYLLLFVNFFNFNTSILCVFVASRQGLIVGFLVSLISISFLFFSNARKNMQTHIIRLFTLLFISGVLISIINGLVGFIKIDYDYFQGFLSKNDQDVERIGQLSSLIDSWWKSPIIGHGNGSTSSWIRDLERPWRYELSFFLRLQNTGLVGTSVYFTAMGYLCFKLFRKFHKTGDKVFISSLAGLISLLIADLTNPYTIRFTVFYYIYYCIWLSMIPDENLMISGKIVRSENKN